MDVVAVLAKPTTDDCCFFVVLATLSLVVGTEAFAPVLPTSLASTALEVLPLMPLVESSLQIAETEAWVAPTASFLDPFLNIMSFAMLARVVLSWYPPQKAKEMPWLFVVFPTEPLLRAVKGVVPPAFGVDITPVVWLGFFTFVHEIMLGQQGLLTMKLKYGI